VKLHVEVDVVLGEPATGRSRETIDGPVAHGSRAPISLERR